MKRPRPLVAGDAVAILSPASIINPDYVFGAVATLSELGFRPRVMPSALGRFGSYSAPAAARLADMTAALSDLDVRAILCSRGGYGAVHLLSDMACLPLDADPKWLIGFSDISALHALWASKGVMSVHASMAKQLAEGADSEAVNRLLEILRGGGSTLSWSATPAAPNVAGEAVGELRGGNMAVLEGLAGTPFDDYPAGAILFIEDVGEPVYKVERMLYRLKLSGVLGRMAALVVGRFTDYEPDRNFPAMESMIAAMTADLGIPVAFNAPVGHIGADNMPLLHGATASLSVTPAGATLTF